jgi:putative membrane-bound dehydrogenase-like protein
MRQTIASVCFVLGYLAGWSIENADPTFGAAVVDETTKDSVIPTGKDGRPLNLNFETGTLKDWTATGDAFKGQPIKGDVVHSRRSDMKSEHAGEYWIGGYERGGDKPQGTLTSVPFTVTQPWASFLVGGGPYENQTCVELVRADTQQVFFRASGHETENLERVVVDLQPHVGKEIFIRLVDKHSGHWGHINFDDFQLHATRPVLALQTPRAPSDVFKFAGLSPEDAAKAMTVPEGFKVSLFAGEPDVVQPIAMAIDDRGRLWVAEAYTYPIRQPEGEGKDRILIFEDTDGDGHFDKRKVFIEGLNLVSGMEVGFGGVWVGASPYLLFIPDKDGDDVPDGKPEVLLDGWGYQDTHETLNSFIWGPDGWLYGCHGIFTHSRVGKPGTPDNQRVPINAGIWRYHPVRHEFEVFAHGTSNPWGVDFNDYGECFATACVIPHLFHIVPNGRYERQAGQHFNPNTYDDIKTIADHRHYVGNQWNDRDRAASDNTGGGHAHAGAMVYLGGWWPEKYRGQIFMNNIHGARINMDTLEPAGSGYAGGHGPDFVLANDLWSQIIYLQYGPDGNAYMIDWYDKNQCHRVERDAHDRSNGRIFKVSYVGENPKSALFQLHTPKSDASGGLNLNRLSDRALAELMLHPNDWFVRHARRILQERAAKQTVDIDSVTAALSKIAFDHADETRRLRGLWALHAVGRTSSEIAQRAIKDKSPHVRAWAIRFAAQDAKVAANGSASSAKSRIEQLAKVAQDDPSPVVRLAIASALQSIPREDRWDIVTALVKHTEDMADPNLALMDWYAMEPLAELDANRALELASHATEPLLEWMARRVGSLGTAEALGGLVDRLQRSGTDPERRAILGGLHESLKGRRQVPMPAGWSKVSGQLSRSDDNAVRQLVARIAVTFGEASAMDAMRRTLGDLKAPIQDRREALASLLGARDPKLAGTLQSLVAESALRREALRGLASYDDAKTSDVILGIYASLSLEEKRDALNTLAARASTARALVAAVGAKKIPTTDLPADVLRQLRNIKDEELGKQIASVWGSMRDTAEDKVREIRRVRGMLASRQAGPDELPRGRAVFAKTCQQCHTLFGTGAKIGPDLTGSNRADMDYLLSNVLDPSAVMAKEYQPNLIAMSDGRVITGLVQRDDGKVLTVATANDTVTIARSDIEDMKLSDKSMMPDDLLKPLSDDEVRALVAYLASPRQVPLLANDDNVKSFWNGQDLGGWDGEPDLWSVENGEIVGKTATGIKRNEFLRSHLLVEDFRLTLQVKLVPNEANSGIQFRSEALADGEMRGPQADIGAGWWGKLYEENGRGLLWDKSGEMHVKKNEWNSYEVIASGSQIRTYINGKPCVELDDSAVSRRGVIAFQIHSGGATEVRFKDLKLELNPPAH